MKNYKDIGLRILNSGTRKVATRNILDDNGKVIGSEPVKTGTIMLPNQFFTHEMSDGFPLLTLRKLHINSIMVELEGFIKGIRSKNWYKERGCNIWNEWANPKVVKENSTNFNDYKKIALETDDLGPIYGSQGRDFNGNKCDQLHKLVETLKKTPNDRRLVVSYWNPLQLNEMALPPCHYAWNCTVSNNNTLNLFWVQRSADFMLGVPFDIAHYGMLLLLLCEETGLKPGNLSACFVDCHIYENHLEAANIILNREELELPTMLINNFTSIFDWTYNDYELANYEFHPNIKMEITV